MRHHMWGEHEVARHALRSRVALGPLANRWSRQGVATSLSFTLVVMPAAHASRDHSKKSTLRDRIRLREKCLQLRFVLSLDQHPELFKRKPARKTGNVPRNAIKCGRQSTKDDAYVQQLRNCPRQVG